MGSKSLSFIILFVIVSSLYAQDSAQNSGFFIETSTRFVQRLTWNPSSHTLRYEVVIERNEGGSFQRVLQEFTEDTFIDVSLTPGNYRYRIIPYDLFNRATQGSVWIDLTIYPALQPELSSFSPQFFIIDSSINEYILEISGNNLVQDSLINLRRHGSESQILVPYEINLQPEGTRVRLHFNFDQLSPGIYLIHVRNPGGLETSFSDFFIELPKVSEIEIHKIEVIREVEVVREIEVLVEVLREVEVVPRIVDHGSFDLSISFVFMPLVNLNNGIENALNPNYYIDGGALRLGFFSINDKMFSFGFEIIGAWYSVFDFITERKFAQYILLENNLILRAGFFNQKMAIMIRIGAGLILGSERAVYANTGLSILYYLFGSFYLETGVNYSYVFDVDNFWSFVRPWIGMGVKF